MTELKPCPFCGRIPKVEDCGTNRFFVKCECGIAQDKLYFQRCDAVRRWNTRRQQPERKTGKWVVFEAPDELHCGLVKCPFCKEELIAKPDEYSYCPNCGAKMEREQP